jgi:hypothetical protein
MCPIWYFGRKFSKPSLSRYSRYRKARFASRPFGPARRARYQIDCSNYLIILLHKLRLHLNVQLQCVSFSNPQQLNHLIRQYKHITIFHLYTQRMFWNVKKNITFQHYLNFENNTSNDRLRNMFWSRCISSLNISDEHNTHLNSVFQKLFGM